jgi:hypothetical protein
MVTDFANISGSFKFNADLFKKMVEGIAPDHRLVRPGGNSNSLLWVTGHAVWARGRALQTLGPEWSRPWANLFARGAALVAQDQYPKPQEILNAWDDVSAKLTSVVEGVTPEVLSKPAPQGIPSFDGKLSGTLAFFSIHESYHIGQMGYLRKWLGYGQSVG